jgi:amidase
MTLSEMTQAMQNKDVSSYEIVSQYLLRIEQTKHLNAVIEINPDAITIARRLDFSNDKSGLLHGIPILLKDNISTGDKMHTSAGSIALANNVAPEDAPIVLNLRKAGAIILGKANMTEFANFMAGSTMPAGYSSRGGQTLNFFDSKADPGGSSTGSAVAVAADLCAAAIGTETFGSIISPSQAAGVIGIKPTAGLLSNKGILPISFTLDTAGPIARCADDARLLLSVLGGREYIKCDEGLRGVRIGICRMFTEDTPPEWLAANERLIELFSELGAICIELPDHPIRIGKLCYHINKHEFKFGINSYLQSMRNPEIPQSLQEIIQFNERHSDIALKYGQDNLVDIDETTSGTMTELSYTDALAARKEAIDAFNRLFEENCIDVFFSLAGNAGLGSWTGFPCMTVPIGKSLNGLPIGSYFAAKQFDESVLLRVASAIEKVR